MTGTFDNWSKSEKMSKVGDVFEKAVDLPDSSERIYYKVGASTSAVSTICGCPSALLPFPFDAPVLQPRTDTDTSLLRHLNHDKKRVYTLCPAFNWQVQLKSGVDTFLRLHVCDHFITHHHETVKLRSRQSS